MAGNPTGDHHRSQIKPSTKRHMQLSLHFDNKIMIVAGIELIVPQEISYNYVANLS